MGQDGRQARWDKHNQQRRLSILDAALEVLEAEPPGADFHVQQIAAHAGLNRTVVYRHFTDRADLDASIEALSHMPIPDQLLIARLKRKKLLLRDEIVKIESRILPDIIA